MSNNRLLETIKSNDLFKGVDFDSLNFPFESKNIIELKEGDLVYSAGQTSDFLYLIIIGEIKLKLTAIKRLFFKSKNEFFGESEILENVNRNSSALANSDCTIYKIDSALFNGLMNKSTALKSNLIHDHTDDDNNNTKIKATTEPVSEKPIIGLISDSKRLDVTRIIEDQIKYDSKVDIDKIEIHAYQQEPDLDSFIQQKYLEKDNKSLKTQLISDPDDIGNWVITEQNLDTITSKSNNTSLKSEKIEVEEEIKSGGNNDSLFSDPAKHDYPKVFEDLDKTAKNILDFLIHKTDSKAGAIYHYSQATQMLEELYQTNESIYKGKKKIKEGITGLVAKSKQIRFAVSFLNDINYDQEIDRPNDYVGETLIVIPFLDSKNELIGIAQLGTDETIFTKEEEHRLKEYTNYCSKILEQSLTKKTIATEKPKVINSTGLTQIANFLMQDVKAPLLTVKHYSSILSRFDLSDEVKKVIKLLSSHTNSVIDFLQASIDFSEKSIKTKLEEVSFNEIMDQNLTALSDYVESRNVKLFKKFSEDVKIKIDVRKFYVACYYISRFTCDVMKQGGSLYFSSHIDGGKIALAIRDENKILNETHFDKVFDPNFSIDNQETIGLSLAISKYIIESMNCSITLHSAESGTSYLVSISISS